MKSAQTITRRELRGFFDHPTAYVLVIAFLGLGLFLLFRSMYAQQIATMRSFFDLLPWLFAVFVPAVTMRAFAEERRSRTLEWLLAQPVTEVDIVVGKFMGNWLFVLVTLAASVPTAIGLLLVSPTDPGVLVAQYIGAALMAAQFVAVGLWASSITRNQITAFILATAVSLVLVLIGLPVVQIGVPRMIASALVSLSVIGHFENVARGVIDLRDVLYFVTTAALFLLLAGVLIQRERLSHTRGAWRRLRYGTLAAAIAVVILNLLGGYLRGRLDLTRDGLYTLSDATRELVASLDDVVQIRLYVSSDLPPEVQLGLRDVQDLLADMRAASAGNLRVQRIDPGNDSDAEREADVLEIRPLNFRIMREDQLEVKRGWFGLAVIYGDRNEVIPYIGQTDDLEYRLASRIHALTSERKPNIVFLTGPGLGDPSAYPSFQQFLGERYAISTRAANPDSLSLSDSVDVVVLTAPMQPVAPAVLDTLTSHLDAGGSVLILMEPANVQLQMMRSVSIETGLAGFLDRHGLAVQSGMVYDLRSRANIGRPYPLMPIAVPAGDHPTTRNLVNLDLFWAGALEVRDTSIARPLWVTTDAGGLQPTEASIDPAAFGRGFIPDSLGVRTVAAVVDPEAGGAAPADARSGRMIVVADASFIEDQFLSTRPPERQLQNVIFGANAIDWLAQDDALIRIRSKNRVPPALVFRTAFARNALKWGNLVGVPLLFALGGFVRIARRRHRAMRAWDDAQPEGTAA